ncbi:MAG TPA: D-alanyl-D-alanine carboxypeptidase, partial [Thermoanaerobaculia bacterium]
TIPASWKVGNIGSDYAAPADALAYNENVAGVVIEHCEQPVIITDPSFVAATAHIACGSGDLSVRSEPNNGLQIEGVMAAPRDRSRRDRRSRAVCHGKRFAMSCAKRTSMCAGTTRVNVTPRAWQERIAIIESPPLFSLLGVMLKVSQNLYAEMLFKSTAGTYRGAEDVEREFLTREVGIDAREFRFVDGCGLSPDDLVSPAAIVSLLRWMNAPPRRGIFWSILATPGEEGTLRRRLVPLAARLRGKTGTIAGVNALSGILAGTHGGYRYFSVVLNHHLADSPLATRAIDAIVNAIADF